MSLLYIIYKNLTTTNKTTPSSISTTWDFSYRPSRQPFCVPALSLHQCVLGFLSTTAISGRMGIHHLFKFPFKHISSLSIALYRLNNLHLSQFKHNCTRSSRRAIKYPLYLQSTKYLSGINFIIHF